MQPNLCETDQLSLNLKHDEQGRLIHKETNKCLDVRPASRSVEGGSGVELVAAPCKAVKSQVWFFDNYVS